VECRSLEAADETNFNLATTGTSTLHCPCTLPCLTSPLDCTLF
jgi:hypothetical protein